MALVPEIDIHRHILPDWDDGPDTLDQSLELCETALKAGLKTLVATPHVGRTFRGRHRSAASIKAGVEALQSELDKRALPLQIVAGAEVMMGKVDLSARLPDDRALTYGQAGKYALIESPGATWPPFGRSLISSMERAGVRAVLAHPERYLDVQKNPQILEMVVNGGALVQLTAGAILGEMGKPNRACALELLRRGWVSFVASDSHNLSHALPHQAVDEVVKTVGEAAAQQIFVENPRRLLAGERAAPPSVETTSVKSGGLFGFLKRG